MQPLAARIGFCARARVTREVVRRVVDAAELDLFQRSAREQRAPRLRGERGKLLELDGAARQCVAANVEASSAFAQSNGSIDKRPLKTHVNAKMPKKAPEM